MTKRVVVYATTPNAKLHGGWRLKGKDCRIKMADRLASIVRAIRCAVAQHATDQYDLVLREV